MLRFEEIKMELTQMAEREAMRLWRMSRRAKNHGVSESIVTDIRNEGSILYDTIRYYPSRLLEWDFEYKFKYAFK